ncbi:MAG TPA: CorA family divalent cation transporter [Methanomicrobiales archaeon]|nr:CorA family divalent cation transporter [Methanomicrobiales archaeon]
MTGEGIGKAREVPALPLEEKAFCALILPEGIQRFEAEDVTGFCQPMKTASAGWIDSVVDDMGRDLLPAAMALGFSELLVRNLQKSPKSGYEDFDTEMGLVVPAIFMQGFDVRLEPLYILINGKVIVTFHSREVKRFIRMRRYAETLLRKIPRDLPPKDRMTLLLVRIIDENNSRNFDYLAEIEEHGDRLFQVLSDPKTPRSVIAPKIYEMKHALIIYLGGLWATVDALSSLRYGDAEILTDEDRILDRINALIAAVQAQIGLAEHLSEVLASGLEVLQSIYNNQLQILNNKLAMLAAYLAIIGTALLVPNTIATIAGNPMFQFTPADAPFFLGIIVLSTIVATGFTIWVLKSRGLLPRDIE